MTMSKTNLIKRTEDRFMDCVKMLWKYTNTEIPHDRIIKLEYGDCIIREISTTGEGTD